MAEEMYQAISGFVTYETGTAVVVRAGETVVEGHWLMKGREDKFKPVAELSRFGKRTARKPAAHKVEKATQEPGEKRAGGISAADVPGAKS